MAEGDFTIELPDQITDLPEELQVKLTRPTSEKNEDGSPRYERLPVDKEIAILEVRGQMFSNWTSVRVEQKWTEAFPTFTFECTEQVDVPLSVYGSQFVPGDVVRVLLGGAPAVYGYITERHVGYDKAQHGVRLIGCGDTSDLVNSSVPLDKLDGHDGKSVTQLAKDLSAHLGIKIHERGNVDSTPFENIQVSPGETPIQAIERYAKMRDILIGSEANGGLLLIGENGVSTKGWLTEGINILRANAVVRDPMVYKKIFAIGQNKGSNSSNGDAANKQVAERDGSSTRNRHMVVVADVADKQHGIERRADMEVVFTEGSEIEAQITVQGWFKDANVSDDIWRAGEYYNVTSPSLILFNEVMGCSGCTYEQSDQGTTTTLKMVQPIHMNGRLSFRNEQLAFRAQQIAQAKAAKEAASAAAAAAPGPGQTQPMRRR
jgi:prophage tail gpP-like protein